MMTVGEPGGKLASRTRDRRHAAGEGHHVAHAGGGQIADEDVGEPMFTTPGAPGTQVGRTHGWVMLPTTAAGRLLIMTVGAQAATRLNGIGGVGLASGLGRRGESARGSGATRGRV